MLVATRLGRAKKGWGAGVAPRSLKLSSLFWRPQLERPDIWLDPEDGRPLHISGLFLFGLVGLLFHLR